MNGLCLFDHPDGRGCIEFHAGKLIVSNEDSDTSTTVLIGPGGMRDLARRLDALADVLDGGAQ